MRAALRSLAISRGRSSSLYPSPVYTASSRMSAASKVIVLDPDVRAGRQVQLGFEREGIATVVPAIPHDLAKLELAADAAPGLAMVGGSDARALELVRRARELMKDVPIVFTGRGASR